MKSVYDIQMRSGRWFSEIDDTRHVPVIVLDPHTADTLFPTGDPDGKELQVEGKSFQVVGVAEPQKTVFAGGENPEDNKIFSR